VFRKAGISYQPSERSKSTIYLEVLPLLNAGRVELLDNQRLVAQLSGLERRTSRSGKDSVDHGPGGHDDLINSAAGDLVLAKVQPVSDAPAIAGLELEAYSMDLGTPEIDWRSML
jgi:hypothetical protein